eukprot:452613-Hanusia_phi.AAC.7
MHSSSTRGREGGEGDERGEQEREVRFRRGQDMGDQNRRRMKAGEERGQDAEICQCEIGSCRKRQCAPDEQVKGERGEHEIREKLVGASESERDCEEQGQTFRNSLSIDLMLECRILGFERLV